MIALLVDTQALIWYLTEDKQLSQRARLIMLLNAQNGLEVGVSVISLVEMTVLVNNGKLPAARFTRLMDELATPDSLLVEVPVGLDIIRLLCDDNLQQVASMQERIIAATALALDVPLISQNTHLQHTPVKLVW